MTKAPSSRPSRFWLYTPFVGLAFIIAIYTTYWFWMRAQLEQGIDTWIAQQRGAGTEISYSSKRLDGFPYRFALTISNPDISRPSTGERWRGQTLQLIMQPWNLSHVIGRAPGRNEILFVGGEPITVQLGGKSAASLSWSENTLRRASLLLDEADISTFAGPIAVEDFAINLGPSPSNDTVLRMAFDWNRIGLFQAPPEADWLGDTLENGSIRAEITDGMGLVGGDLDIATWLRGGPRIILAQGIINWGPVRLGAKGDVGLLPMTCMADGIANVRLENVDGLKNALEQAGQLSDDVNAGLTGMAFASRDGGFATMTFREGVLTFLGQEAATLPPICGTG
ncbi:MAG: DUF2125 domain-containing protein [Pseudomonadota bacterium]